MFWCYTRIDFTWRANGSALEGWKKEDSEDEGGQLGASRPENRGGEKRGPNLTAFLGWVLSNGNAVFFGSKIG